MAVWPASSWGGVALPLASRCLSHGVLFRSSALLQHRHIVSNTDRRRSPSPHPPPSFPQMLSSTAPKFLLQPLQLLCLWKKACMLLVCVCYSMMMKA